jgi:hypothetical protein
MSMATGEQGRSHRRIWTCRRRDRRRYRSRRPTTYQWRPDRVRQLAERRVLCGSWGAHRGLADGAFAWKAGSNSWSATRKWLAKEVWNLQKGQEVHHWLIEQGSAIGKLIPNRIKNQPWNLNPMPSKAWHHFLHDLDPLTRKLLGAPGWAKGVGMGVGVSMVGASGDSCGCQ